MYAKLKKDIENGIAKFKWFATLFSERIRIEISLFKLLYRYEELNRKKDELFRRIGEEVYALRGTDKNIYARPEVIAAIQELDQLQPEIEETIKQASDISKISA